MLVGCDPTYFTFVNCLSLRVTFHLNIYYSIILIFITLNALTANPTQWSNTAKVGCCFSGEFSANTKKDSMNAVINGKTSPTNPDFWQI